MRVTIKDLQSIVDRINRITNSPMEPYTKTPDGKYKANVGNYHLSQAYGGVDLHRMSNEAGGVYTPLNCGHVSKRELQKLLFSYISGLTEERKGEK